MSAKIVPFSGKGGSGKTTLAALVLRQLVRTGVRPILAVDADPNATLSITLGVQAGQTIADLRDRMGQAAANPGEIPKDRLMDLYLAELLSEQEGFDLLTMGRPEGPKCYCYVNGLLRRYLSLLARNYACILVDCEAGMEYLSRLVVEDVRTLVLVAQATPVGLTTVGRIVELAKSLPMRVERRVLAVNHTLPGPMADPAIARRLSQAAEIHDVVHVPFDEDVSRRCVQGLPIDEQTGPAARSAVAELAECCLPDARQVQPNKEPIP